MANIIAGNANAILRYRFAPRSQRMVVDPAWPQEVRDKQEEWRKRDAEEYAELTEALGPGNPKRHENFGKLMAACREVCHGCCVTMTVGWRDGDAGIVEMRVIVPKGVDPNDLYDLVPIQVDMLLRARGVLSAVDPRRPADFFDGLYRKLMAKLEGTRFAEPIPDLPIVPPLLAPGGTT